MKNSIVFAFFIAISFIAKSQISFFNMPNPDMLPQVGNMYGEYDLYQTIKNNDLVNAHVTRLSVQATPFLEVGSNVWYNRELDNAVDKWVIATKWRVWLHQSEDWKVSFSPGSWSSIYFDKDIPVKNVVYGFLGASKQHTDVIYTRLMLGSYGKYWKNTASTNDYYTMGLIAGLEQRLSKKFVLVSDYFQGSGEGFGWATGFVFYAMNDGANLPLYLAFQKDNDSPNNNLVIFEIGYTFKGFAR